MLFEERVPSPHQIAAKQRSPRSHLMGLRSRLGKAAVIGGHAYVERFVTSDEFAAIFMHGLDRESRKAAIDMVARIVERTRRSTLSVKAPSRDVRVKLRWTDELIARLRAEAPKSTDDVELAGRLGLPPYCRGAVRAARSRYGLLPGSRMGEPQSRPQAAPPRAPIAVAA
jgi:hypothetical protein